MSVLTGRESVNCTSFLFKKKWTFASYKPCHFFSRLRDPGLGQCGTCAHSGCGSDARVAGSGSSNGARHVNLHYCTTRRQREQGRENVQTDNRHYETGGKQR